MNRLVIRPPFHIRCRLLHERIHERPGGDVRADLDGVGRCMIARPRWPLDSSCIPARTDWYAASTTSLSASSSTNSYSSSSSSSSRPSCWSSRQRASASAASITADGPSYCSESTRYWRASSTCPALNSNSPRCRRDPCWSSWTTTDIIVPRSSTACRCRSRGAVPRQQRARHDNDTGATQGLEAGDAQRPKRPAPYIINECRLQFSANAVPDGVGDATQAVGEVLVRSDAVDDERRRSAIGITGGRIGTGIDQRTDDVWVSHAGSVMQRGRQCRARPDVHVGACREQALDRRLVTVPGRIVKRGPPLVVQCVNVGADIVRDVPVHCGTMQRVPVLPRIRCSVRLNGRRCLGSATI